MIGKKRHSDSGMKREKNNDGEIPYNFEKIYVCQQRLHTGGFGCPFFPCGESGAESIH